MITATKQTIKGRVVFAVQLTALEATDWYLGRAKRDGRNINHPGVGLDYYLCQIAHGRERGPLYVGFESTATWMTEEANTMHAAAESERAAGQRVLDELERTHS